VPKRRGRKRKPDKTLPSGVVSMTPRVHQALLERCKALIGKSGREPGPDDPVFFDPDKDLPTPIGPGRLEASLQKTLRESGIDPKKADAIGTLLR